MELNKSSSPEKSDPAVAATTTNDEQCSSPPQAQAQAQPRTYECNFCKRGFSNAQALGGHMNIHRKDKAKLKQTSPIPESRSQQFLEIPKTALSPATNLVINPTRSTFPERRDAVAANWTWNYSSENRDTASIMRSDQGYVGEPKQLPLFNEATTLRVVDDHQDQKQSYDKELSSSSSHGDHDEDHDELDLELRLGQDPSLDSSSSTAKSTRKFF
ncbi:hypothetical protein DCAR_0208378 [Daucus carota subsp. sativus]|uniref:C2H2-type domain-containing protein n=1 Tax=Daucus carota subsp. sativus TaxID=79200 RepID=A0AAF0WGI7_DAUCS|nr:PREDICTED: transcriptional regulator TAC1-like [Daucus carota subsp. sativus]WOG89142.1 hypothetical protein DCAR_0208378 [Daucus carota subsp. sativus]